jgi:uncharacterized protein YndB with AHSA1/START domain
MTQVTLVRHIRARPSTVFDLLSTAEGLTSWWGPDDLPVISAEADVRVGGGFRVRFRRFDGGEHECVGEFLEIVPLERLLMSWQWYDGGVPEERGRVSRVELHVRPDGAGTEVMLIHAGLGSAESKRSHQEGWNGALDKYCRRWAARETDRRGDEG